MGAGTNDKQVITRLQRIESRLVRGFDELGVRVQDDADWFSVDHARRIITLTTMAKSVSSIRMAMVRAGCGIHLTYDVRVGDTRVCSIALDQEDFK